MSVNHDKTGLTGQQLSIELAEADMYYHNLKNLETEFDSFSVGVFILKDIANSFPKRSSQLFCTVTRGYFRLHSTNSKKYVSLLYYQ